MADKRGCHSSAQQNYAHGQIMTEKNVFLKIIDGEMPCDKVFENERIIAFKDIAPVAPVHILIVPKKPIANLSQAQVEDMPLLAEILLVANQLAKKFQI